MDRNLGPPVRPVRPVDLMGRPIRIKWTLTDPHGKSDLPCPCWLPPGPPHRRAGRRRHIVGHGRKGADGMSGVDPVGDNGTAGTDGKDGQAWTKVVDTGMWVRPFWSGTGMWVQTLWRV